MFTARSIKPFLGSKPLGLQNAGALMPAEARQYIGREPRNEARGVCSEQSWCTRTLQVASTLKRHVSNIWLNDGIVFV